MTASDQGDLTETENELYDRQIRVWGLEAQKSLRTANILIAGLNGFGAELTKNIILSGVNTVVLQDDLIVTEEDSTSQFLVPRTALGKNRAEASIGRAKKLNPMVKISADTEPLSAKNEDFFVKFNVVVVSGASKAELLRIDEICRKHDIKFFAADVWGMYGYCFSDLNEHVFYQEGYSHKIIENPNAKPKTELISKVSKHELIFPPFSALLQFDFKAPTYQKRIKRMGPALIVVHILQKFREEFNRDPNYKSRNADIVALKLIRDQVTDEDTVPNDRFDFIFCQISPAAAVVGGMVGQEVIKAVTKNEAPVYNVFFFDPKTCNGYIEEIGKLVI